jgi:hypothetical protein
LNALATLRMFRAALKPGDMSQIPIGLPGI